MRDLGYAWTYNEFIDSETAIKPAKHFDQISIEISLRKQKAPQVEAEEQEEFC